MTDTLLPLQKRYFATRFDWRSWQLAQNKYKMMFFTRTKKCKILLPTKCWKGYLITLCSSFFTEAKMHDNLKELTRKLNKSLLLALLFCFNLTKVISDSIQVGLKPYLTKLGFDSNPAWVDIWYAQLETQSINSNCDLNFIA